MIANDGDYNGAIKELQFLDSWLARLQTEDAGFSKAITRMSIRKKVCQLHKELGDYEAKQAGNLVEAPK